MNDVCCDVDVFMISTRVYARDVYKFMKLIKTMIDDGDGKVKISKRKMVNWCMQI